MLVLQIRYFSKPPVHKNYLVGAARGAARMGARASPANAGWRARVDRPAADTPRIAVRASEAHTTAAAVGSALCDPGARVVRGRQASL